LKWLNFFDVEGIPVSLGNVPGTPLLISNWRAVIIHHTAPGNGYMSSFWITTNRRSGSVSVWRQQSAPNAAKT